MKLDEYQEEAKRTAIYPGKLMYPALGLCGEAGELTDACRKRSTHEAINKENGDCFWYIANVAADAGLRLSEVCGRKSFFPMHYCPFWDVAETCEELFVNAGVVAENIKKALRDNNGDLTPGRKANIRKALKRMVLALTYIPSVRTGASLETCAEMNLEKLRSRKERGKLGGDGDDR